MNAIEHLHKLAQEAIVLPEVGNYVRTEYGIDKIIGYRYESEYENGHVVWFEKSDSGCRFTDKDLPKSSPNIIDLIEVGDYVNGCYVTNRQANHNEGITIIPKRIGIIKCNAYFNQGNYNDCEFKWVEEKDIKSIVTREMFESMKYKVGD